MGRKVISKRGKQLHPPGLKEPDPRSAIIGRLHPPFIVRGKGAYVWSHDGRKYIDCALGWGSVILGHANRQVRNAVRRQAGKGTVFTGTSPVSLEVANLIVKMVPCAQNVRFGKNGSDATLAAVRIARSLTGREKIAQCGYHGFHDWSMANDWCNRGIPKSLRNEVLRVDFNDASSLQKVILPSADEIAAIIIDPLANNLASSAYLAAARELADQTGAVLIFDEIMSGFRVARGGIQEIYGIQPDIVCLGKALANGMPLSAIAGSEEMMKEFANVWYGLTFEQDCISLAAAKACLQLIQKKNIPETIGKRGRILKAEYKRIADELGLESELVGADQRPIPHFKDSLECGSEVGQFIRFISEMYARGVIFTNALYLSYAHDDKVIEYIVSAFKKALEKTAKPDPDDPYFNIPSRNGLKADLQIIALKTVAAAQSAWEIEVSVKNTGASNWLPSASGFGGVNLGGHLFDERERLLNHDFYRHHLPASCSLESGPNKNEGSIQPGDSIQFNCDVPVPESKGRYFIEFDLVSEGVTWFKDNGSKTVTIDFTVS